MSNITGTRGKLILIEGLDRTGKTTQCNLISSRLNYKYYKFPNRETPIGQIINSYLTKQVSDIPLSDQSVHLLFSSNRWEFQNEIKTALLNGQNIIVDRYIYSGIAYSVAKNVAGMDYNWCSACDRGLIKPDLTVFLINDGNFDNHGFGDELYEKHEFQVKVSQVFMDIFYKQENKDYISNHFKQLDVSGMNIEEVYSNIESIVDSFTIKDLNLLLF
ncbi:hypothetical protein QEN19_003811 [Hanseniaspora menglaensis]